MTEHLSEAQIQHLFRSIPAERDRLLARFLYESGCSIAEACALRTNAVHKDGTVRLADRTAWLSPSLAHELLAQAGTHVFASRQAAAMTPKRAQQILKPFLAGVGAAKPTPHVLRYSHIIHAYHRGLSLAAIAHQTGLSAVRVAQIVAGIKTTQHYGALFADTGRRGE